METKQTAVEYLEEKMFYWLSSVKREPLLRYIEQAKAMEKEQIINAWKNGFMSSGEGWNGEIPPECYGEKLDIEQFYTETYGK